MSRDKLQRLSGVSASQIGNIETQGATPTRWTVMALAGAIPGWDVDEALQLLDYEPLTEDERAELEKLNGARAQLDHLLDELPPTQIFGLLGFVQTIVNPQTLPASDERSGRVTVYQGTEDLGEEHTEVEPSAEERSATPRRESSGPVQNGPAPS